MEKTTGFIRRIDNVHEISIPSQILKDIKIKPGDPLEIFLNDRGDIILRKYTPHEGAMNNLKEALQTMNTSDPYYSRLEDLIRDME